MNAVLYEKPHHLRVVSKPLRRLGEREVLVRVSACGICGTDVHIVEGTSRSTPPVILGHEYAGSIEDVGSSTRGLKPGDRVAVDPNIACGTCYYCRRGLVHLCANLRALGVDLDGGMAEYCIVPESQLYPLPDGLTTEQCAFIEPISCAVHGIDRANIPAGATVLILGGGTIGLLMLQLAKVAGAARTIVVEPLAHKRAIAEKLGAEILIDPVESDPITAIMDTTRVGVDVVIECAGKASTMQLALRASRRGGTVVFFGVCAIGESIPVEPYQVYARELTIAGSYVNPHTFDRAIALLNEGKVRIEDFLIHRFPLAGIDEALRYQKEGLTIKSIITPNP
ncbi:MAG TPA: zinc-dependent alcohol dehydrogenase family protein [Bacteroidota bacterium]|nr:zinc-dependent alcohol dehydrogenase family protein [Bacteroidota bacterium]